MASDLTSTLACTNAHAHTHTRGTQVFWQGALCFVLERGTAMGNYGDSNCCQRWVTTGTAMVVSKFQGFAVSI